MSELGNKEYSRWTRDLFLGGELLEEVQTELLNIRPENSRYGKL